MKGTTRRHFRKPIMDVFVVSEPLYDICESWAEEPEPEAWDAVYPEVLAWLIRLN
jgi:hypothetical protein